MIFRKLLNSSIPKPILHYDFSEITDNKCPNKGSLGNDYDLQIVGDSDRLPYKSKGYPLALWYLSDYTVEKTEDIWSFSWDLLYPGISPTSGEFWFDILISSEISFGLYVENTSFKTGMWQLVSKHPTEDGFVDVGPQMPLVAGWNIITLDATGVSEPHLRIITESDTVTNFGGTILTLKQTPIFNNCFVTGNEVYGKLADGVNFTFNKDSGFSTIAVREPFPNTSGIITWSKDDATAQASSFESTVSDTQLEVSSFGYSNNVLEYYTDSSISYGTSKSYNGHSIIRGTINDSSDRRFLLGAWVNDTSDAPELAIKNSAQRELLIWNRDLTDSQLQEYISKNIIPIPEVYYDVDKQQALNTDEGKEYLIDYSGHGHHGELKNFTYTDPVWTQISFNVSSDYPSSGGGNDYDVENLSINNVTIFKVNAKNPNAENPNILDRPFKIFNAYNKKITIAINGLANGEQLRFYSTSSDISFSQILNNGNNIIDLSNIDSQNIYGYFVIAPLSGKTLSFTNPIYIVIFPFFDESSANGWGYQQLPNLDSWVEQNTSIISKNKVKLTGTNGHYDSLTYSILPIYHDNSIAVFSPFKARFKVETTKESGQIGFAADGHVGTSDGQVVQGAYISYIDNGYVNVDFPGYIWDVSNLEMSTDPYLYCYPSLNNNSIIEQLPIQDYLTMNGDLNNQIDINSEDTYQTILVDMEVSEGGESELNNYNNNLTNYINFSPLYRTSKLYKYLAFKENLTDDQIQLVIDKYGFKYPLQLVFNNDFNNDFKWN